MMNSVQLIGDAVLCCDCNNGVTLMLHIPTRSYDVFNGMEGGLLVRIIDELTEK